MPVYEYKCTECGQRFEIEQRMTDEPFTSLPGDGHTHALKKVFSPVGISFRGSGFYKTDSATTRPKTTPSSETAPTSGSESGSSGDSDSQGTATTNSSG